MTTAATVAFVDLQAQLEELRPELDRAIAEVIESSAFILGPQVGAFEQAFARYCGTAHAVGVDSGFSAIELVLRGLRLEPGDEVITQANTFIATVSAVQEAGLKPVLVDCRDDGSLDPAAAAAAIGPRTRVLMPVWLYGRVTDADAWRRLAAEAQLTLVEDACQAHGAESNGLRAGSIGNAAAFSFYPGKNLGAFGDAGGITTADPALATWLRQVRHYGQSRKYEHTNLALNRRLDTLQAAVLLVKLGHLDAWNRRRISLADAYREGLGDLPLQLPAGDAGGSHVYHLFPVLSDDRDALLAALEAAGIQAGIHYPQAVHEAPSLALDAAPSAFPVARGRARRMVSLPIHPHLGFDGVDRVVEVVRRHLAG